MVGHAEETVLTPGRAISGSLATGQWAYGRLSLTLPSTIRWNVAQVQP